jgi:hypothetical protein
MWDSRIINDNGAFDLRRNSGAARAKVGGKEVAVPVLVIDHIEKLSEN